MANNKNITFNQLEASMTKVKAAIDKKANTNHGTHVPTTGTANNATYLRNDNQWHKIVPSDIGAAPTSHGDHVTYSNTSPSAPGTASAGSAANVSRGDHVHPLQTTISGNAGTATKLANARTLTIGNTGKTFDGSANVSWSLNEIGAAPNTHSHNILNIKGSNTISSTANDTTANWVQQNNSVHWYSTARQITNQPSEYGFLVNLASGGDVHQIWMTQSAGNMYHRGGNGSGWNGDTWRTILDSSNFTSYSPTLSGGGAIGTWGISITGNANTATSASKLTTARNIGKASFNGTSDIYLSDIMGRADTSSTANQYKNQHTKFARIDVSDRTYNACVGKISFINTEANAAKGILEFYIRTQDTIANSYIELCWSSLTDKKYADSVSAVKVSDGVFDLYYQPKNDWNTAKFTIIDCHKPKKITLYSDQEYVSSITPVCTSSLNAQYVDNIYTDYVSNRVLTLTTDKYQYAAITSNNTIINLPSVSSFTEIHLFFDWPSGISIIMPSNVKWQEGVMYGPGHTHEFIFTYVNSDIGWLGGCVVYG